MDELKLAEAKVDLGIGMARMLLEVGGTSIDPRQRSLLEESLRLYQEGEEHLKAGRLPQALNSIALAEQDERRIIGQ